MRGERFSARAFLQDAFCPPQKDMPSDTHKAREMLTPTRVPGSRHACKDIVSIPNRHIKREAFSRRLPSFFRQYYFIIPLLSFWITSCAPPSTMLVAETNVRTAFFCSSGIVSAPQLHMVDLTLANDIATLSFSVPA